MQLFYHRVLRTVTAEYQVTLNLTQTTNYGYKVGPRLDIQMSHLMTKPIKLHVCPVKTDQPGHLPSLIRVFAVCMKKAWVLSYSSSASEDSDQPGHPTAKTVIRLGKCPGWSESLLGAHAILLDLSRGGSDMDCETRPLVNTRHPITGIPGKLLTQIRCPRIRVNTFCNKYINFCKIKRKISMHTLNAENNCPTEPAICSYKNLDLNSER